MTTGRINQVTAESERPGPSGPRVCDGCIGCWRVNASSHGFRTCPYPASRRRQDPLQRIARLDEVPPIVSFAAPARLLICRSDPRSVHRPTCGWNHLYSGCYRCGRLSYRRVGVATIDPYDPSKSQALKSIRTSLLRGAEFQVGEAVASQTRGTLAVSRILFRFAFRSTFEQLVREPKRPKLNGKQREIS